MTKTIVKSVPPPCVVHKPCAFNTNGATKEYCTEVSSVYARNLQGCMPSQCTSPWRVVLGAEAKPAPVPVRREPRVMPQKIVPPTLVVRPSVVVASSTHDATMDRWRSIIGRVKKAIASAEFMKVDPKRIRPMPSQPRDYFDEEELSMLEQSVREVGQIQPGMIRPVVLDTEGRDLELLDGERRWRIASRIDGLEYRAMRIEIDDEAAPFVVAAIANFNRSGHTPMEISDAIERMNNPEKGLGMPMEEVAKLLGLSLIWAYSMHSLQRLHPRVRDMLDPKLTKKDNRLPITGAIHISKLHIGQQVALAQRVLAKEVSMRGLRKEVLRIADETGTFVRTRAVQPRKRVESIENISRNLSVLANDLCDRLRESDIRPVLRSRPSGQIHAIRARLTNVETRVLEAKHLMASILKTDE